MPVAFAHVAVSLKSLEHPEKKAKFPSSPHDVDEKVNPRHSGRLFNKRHRRCETRKKRPTVPDCVNEFPS